ncbi:ABC transporter ATP-binding protein [Pseudoflavonifractor sp. HCP28S3_F10]|uniref:ABC transporter ATP-binding protein n=1 Tax=Pseudoflavonifractor sp. HCP28S3_F10 TaxID=3438947 RepID=UPI003F89D212
MEHEPTNMQQSSVPILRLEGLTKKFGMLTACDNVSLSIQKGEVHVFFGENGAGKSTLSNMIYGYLRPTSGNIYINGKLTRLRSPKDAAAHNIGMVHQHFMLVPTLSGMKNLLLGLDYGKGPLLDMRRARERAEELCKRYGVDIDLDKEIWRLSVGEQQWIEILKALFLGSDILILDEPTAVLTVQEVETLMGHILDMKREGITVIMVSHKLKEIDQVADRISVLRRGKLIGTVNAGEVTHEQLIKMMIGRSYDMGVKKPPLRAGSPVLQLRDVSTTSAEKACTLDGVTLDVRAGEIFGIAGVSGNGQNHLYRTVTALQAASQGEILLNGKPISTRVKFEDWYGERVAEIPEDRIEHGSIGQMTLEENLIFGAHREKEYHRHGMLNWGAVSRMSKRRVEEFDVRPADIKYPARSLSGGNLQKLVLSRELTKGPRLIVAAQPTRGLDVIAVEFIWKKLLEAREQGVACLLISEDLDELVALSDRIGVLYKGKLVKIFDGEFSLSEIGDRMINGGDQK